MIQGSFFSFPPVDLSSCETRICRGLFDESYKSSWGLDKRSVLVWVGLSQSITFGGEK